MALAIFHRRGSMRESILCRQMRVGYLSACPGAAIRAGFLCDGEMGARGRAGENSNAAGRNITVEPLTNINDILARMHAGKIEGLLWWIYHREYRTSCGTPAV